MMVSILNACADWSILASNVRQLFNPESIGSRSRPSSSSRTCSMSMDAIVEYLKTKDRKLRKLVRIPKDSIAKYIPKDKCVYIHNLDVSDEELKRVIKETDVSFISSLYQEV